MSKQLSTQRSSQSVWDFMNEVERIFDQNWSAERSLSREVAQFQPRIDIHETEDSFLIAADLPGMSRDQVQISFHEGRLSISGKRQNETKVDKPNYHRTERFFGEFERSFQLPSGIDEEKIQARLEDGVLEVLIPKPQAAKSRSIAIEGEKKGLFSKLLGSSQPDKSQH